MRFLKPIPDLGPCEGRWVTAFGSRRGCSNRASESFDSPCGHVHRLCATCTYALERGLGTWDETEDILRFGAVPTRAAVSAREGERPSDLRSTDATSQIPVWKATARRRHSERVPLQVAFAGIGLFAALIAVSLPGVIAAGPMALGTAMLLYGLALRHTWNR